jgi:uncharacterized protein YdaU (DUF1376 family)
MNFYPHHLGDYAKDTGHLSVTEHGAYRLLMDHYYSTEKPLPEDFPALFRVCRATTHIEKVAVKSVVAKFFPLENGVRTHKRIEHELSIYRERVDVNKENGKKGGRPPKQKPNGFPVGSVGKTQTKPKNNPIQDPITNNQINPPAEGDEKELPSRQTQILKYWKDEFKTHFGTEYSFHEKRQFKELQTLLSANPNLSPDEFMDVANEAWKASADKFRKAVKESRTITGLCQNWNAIRAELQTVPSAPKRELPSMTM